MARLLIGTEGGGIRALDLHLGVNRIGRDPGCEFPIDHESVSTSHCDVIVSHDGVTIRDCGSTNGTFVAGEPVKEAKLHRGQTLYLGDVELLVENTDVNVAIPKFERERPKPPVMLSEGVMICPRHSREQAIFRCTHCHEVMCGYCVRPMRRHGGKMLLLCPLCSHKCEPIYVEKRKKKKGFLGFILSDTVRFRFRRSAAHKKRGKSGR